MGTYVLTVPLMPHRGSVGEFPKVSRAWGMALLSLSISLANSGHDSRIPCRRILFVAPTHINTIAKEE